MAKSNAKRYSSIHCPLSFLFRLQFRMGNKKEPYHKYLTRMLDERDQLYEVNKELRRRLDVPKPEQQMVVSQ